MTSAEDRTISVSPDVADRVARKVRSGEYPTIDDVIREGLAALDERNSELETWLREEVVPGHAEYMADPSQAVSAADLLDSIRARRGTAPAK